MELAIFTKLCGFLELCMKYQWKHWIQNKDLDSGTEFTFSGNVRILATWTGTATSSIRRLGSGEMTVRPEKSTLFPERLPLNRPKKIKTTMSSMIHPVLFGGIWTDVYSLNRWQWWPCRGPTLLPLQALHKASSPLLGCHVERDARELTVDVEGALQLQEIPVLHDHLCLGSWDPVLSTERLGTNLLSELSCI